jgi:hypothetical protein
MPCFHKVLTFSSTIIIYPYVFLSYQTHLKGIAFLDLYLTSMVLLKHFQVLFKVSYVSLNLDIASFSQHEFAANFDESTKISLSVSYHQTFLSFCFSDE